MKAYISTLFEQLAAIVQKDMFSSSNVHEPELPTTSQESEIHTLPRKCFLKDFKGKHVGYGELNTLASPKENVYNIILGEIFNTSADLYDVIRKLEDVMPGELINWPKYSVQLL